MHLTGITKRASRLIAAREPAQPVAKTTESEVARKTAKLPSRNITVHHHYKSAQLFAQAHRTYLIAMQLWFQSWGNVYVLSVRLVSPKLVVLTQPCAHRRKMTRTMQKTGE